MNWVNLNALGMIIEAEELTLHKNSICFLELGESAKDFLIVKGKYSEDLILQVINKLFLKKLNYTLDNE